MFIARGKKLILSVIAFLSCPGRSRVPVFRITEKVYTASQTWFAQGHNNDEFFQMLEIYFKTIVSGQ